MTVWEKKIIDAFIDHYYVSAPDPSAVDIEERSSLRIRTSIFFPGFDSAHPDEKESYLEAAESLERKGVIRLNWERRGKGERLKTLSCENFEKLFEEAGKPFPKTEAETIRSMFSTKVKYLKETLKRPAEKTTEAEKVIAFLEFLSMHFSPQEIGKGIDRHKAEDYIKLLEFCCNPVQTAKLTTRALSITLYNDSKYLEKLMALCKPLLSQAEKKISIPDLSFLERSFPETMISGKIIIRYKNKKSPLINACGHILGITLENAEEIENIQLISAGIEKMVLTIENKDTFYALGSPQKHYANKELSRFNCFLYIGGYSNRATAVFIKILAASGFSFYHAGDLDPDGILILQQIQEIAQKPVTPVCMDAATFDKYRAWARTLSKPMLHQSKKIKKETRAVPELAGLLQRIEETGLGVEQEIIDYRFSYP